jgi:hypothetical protein
VAAGVHDIRIEIGATYVKELTWKDGDGVVKDITGATGAMMIRYALDDAGTAASLSSAGGTITNGGVTGKFTVTISAAVTGAMTPGMAVWDFMATETSGVVTKLIGGAAVIVKGVTR